MSIPALELLLDSPTSGLTAAIDDTSDTSGTGIYIPFNSGADDYDVTWSMKTPLEGWDSPDLPEGADSKSGDDGLWDNENFFGGRTLTIKGALVAPTYAAREAAEYRLRQAVVRNRLVAFTVNETVPKQVMARRSGRLLITPVTDTLSEYSISLLAPDPRKYATSPITASIAVIAATGGLAPPWTPPVLLPELDGGSSQATLLNAGIYDTPPTITIYGPGSFISIHNLTTNKHLTFNALVLGASDFITINVAAGTALLGGTSPRAPSTGSAVIGDFKLDPGENSFKIFGTLTGATPPSATITAYSAWT